jgi:hypothetical protein
VSLPYNCLYCASLRYSVLEFNRFLLFIIFPSGVSISELLLEQVKNFKLFYW